MGYRVNSIRASQFRQWATSVLRQYAIRGYVPDKKRMENGTFLGEDYCPKNTITGKKNVHYTGVWIETIIAGASPAINIKSRHHPTPNHYAMDSRRW